MRYWFPYPLLSFALMVFWLLINQSLSIAQILLGAALGISHAWLMVNLRPSKTHTKKAWLVARLAGQVTVDVARSNLAVMRAILRSKRRPVRSGFIAIDITLRDENSIALLACILTATPGTAWIEFDSQTRVLLLHVLDIENGPTWADLIRTHYEAPLKELFE
ncbi:Na+/H+ antiporter subunit E [Pararhizobium antarcticum]|uniref:Cation:proton antiporter n=1 Tax=Pararhizobium antarcticum TaxID=1798805 RepID=A0A657LZT1_9HYPH|nr:Na+/H+ antiporter subunit E [Pararhizobium antarcticum]OJF96559.1 cation:proton antiporter [Rhizobium sp. 58]OJG01436.1 cation:proton antiporter [Pararhizobium antarcticum]